MLEFFKTYDADFKPKWCVSSFERPSEMRMTDIAANSRHK